MLALRWCGAGGRKQARDEGSNQDPQALESKGDGPAVRGNQGGRPGCKSDGELEGGSIQVDTARPRPFRWRKQGNQKKKEKEIATPWRTTRQEAMEDHIQVYRAREGIADETERKEVMRRTAASLHNPASGMQYQYRIHGTF